MTSDARREVVSGTEGGATQEDRFDRIRTQIRCGQIWGLKRIPIDLCVESELCHIRF